MSTFALSVCVCTRNRPTELTECLQSIAESSVPVAQVIVSDDGIPDGPAVEICREHGAEYLRGPRKGLCANRNRALSRVTGTHVLFLDDDALLSQQFVATVRSRIDGDRDPDAPDRLIVSGREVRPGGHVTAAREQSFLGFQEVEYRDGDVRRTIVINATVFPSSVFDQLRFDERIVYGYDEVDLTTRAVAAGWRIASVPEAINQHNHSSQSRTGYAEVQDATRIYVTFKRYMKTDCRQLRAIRFALVAPLHLLAASVRRSGLSGIPQALRSMRLALALSLAEARR
ncbi:MAG: glycosyltransferase [Thermoleophilaceae bacterium]|nr:glycosyltransferase [Thermoleophilaceae bacterium]